MGYFQVRYNSRVVIYDRRAFIRLATGDGIEVIVDSLVVMVTSLRLVNPSSFKKFRGFPPSIRTHNLKYDHPVNCAVCFIAITCRFCAFGHRTNCRSNFKIANSLSFKI